MTDDTKIADLTVGQFRELMRECVGQPPLWKPGMKLKPGGTVQVGCAKYVIPEDVSSEYLDRFERLLTKEAELAPTYDAVRAHIASRG